MKSFTFFLRQEAGRISCSKHYKSSLRMPSCFSMSDSSPGPISFFGSLTTVKRFAQVQRTVTPRAAFRDPPIGEMVPSGRGFHLPQKLAALHSRIVEHFCSMRNSDPRHPTAAMRSAAAVPCPRALKGLTMLQPAGKLPVCSASKLRIRARWRLLCQAGNRRRTRHKPQSCHASMIPDPKAPLPGRSPSSSHHMLEVPFKTHRGDAEDITRTLGYLCPLSALHMFSF